MVWLLMSRYVASIPAMGLTDSGFVGWRVSDGVRAPLTAEIRAALS